MVMVITCHTKWSTCIVKTTHAHAIVVIVMVMVHITTGAKVIYTRGECVWGAVHISCQTITYLTMVHHDTIIVIVIVCVIH